MAKIKPQTGRNLAARKDINYRSLYKCISVSIKELFISACPSVMFGCCSFQNCLQVVSEKKNCRCGKQDLGRSRTDEWEG